MIPIEDGVNALTQEKEEKFTVKKIDVWSFEWINKVIYLLF